MFGPKGAIEVDVERHSLDVHRAAGLRGGLRGDTFSALLRNWLKTSYTNVRAVSQI